MKKAEIFAKQEKMLRFLRFTNSDGFALGCFLADYAREQGLRTVLSVKRLDGLTLFQFATDGAEQLNAHWAEMKSQTVRVFGKSSMRSAFEADQTGQTVEAHGLQDRCRFAPGGFPIRLMDGTLAGAVAVSGVDMEEQDLLVTLLAQYLKIPNVPLMSQAEE